MSLVNYPVTKSLVLALSFTGSYQAFSDVTSEKPKSNTGTQAIEEIEVISELSRYSATKSDAAVMDTPRSITVINQQDILDKGAMSLDDTFMYSAGVTGQPYGFESRADSVFIRGFKATQYQDSLQSIFGDYTNARSHIYTLEQVEILKGPSSVLYGAGTPGGLVNTVSKRPKAESHNEVVLEAGTFDHKQIAMDFTGAFDSDATLIYRFVGVAKDSGTQVDHVEEKTYVLAPSLTWQPSDKTAITALVNLTKTESDTGPQFLPIKGTLTPALNGKKIGSETYLGDPNFNRFDTENKSITLLASHQVNDIWVLEATARHTQGSADYRQAWPSFIPDMPGFIDRYPVMPDASSNVILVGDGLMPRTYHMSDRESKQSAIDFRNRIEFDTGLLNHDVLVGVQYQSIETKEKFMEAKAMGLSLDGSPHNLTYWINVFNPTYGSTPSLQEIDAVATYQGSIPPEMLAQLGLPSNAFLGKGHTSTKTSSTGIYVSDQMTIDRWIINAGIRFDQNETNGQDDNAISLSAGGMYQFDNGLASYISYAESFEPVIGVDKVIGKSLKPMEGQQLEAGIKYQHSTDGIYVALSYFDIAVTNIYNPNQLNGVNTQQEGESNVSGVELESILPLGDFTLQTTFSHLETENPMGYQLASVPEIQASTWVTYRPTTFMDGFKAGLGVRYNGESSDGTDTLKTPSATLGDMMLGYEMENWDFSLNVRNVTDKEYLTTCLNRGDCYFGKRRTAIARIAMSF